MKRSILLFTAVAGISYLTLTSNKTGVTAPEGDRTGSPLSGGQTCNACHSGGAGTTTGQIQVKDMQGNVVTSYTAGNTYSIWITGSNTANPPLTKFGFQFVALKSGNMQAGNFSVTSPVKTAPKGTAPNIITYVEHTNPLDAVSGYNVTFTWFPPAAGTGLVNMYAMLNAVNNDNATTGDRPTASGIVLSIPETPASVSELSQNIRITAYPNPVTDKMSLKFEDAERGIYTVSVFDLTGRKLRTEELQVSSTTANMTLHTSNWTPGLYFAQIVKDGAQRMIPVVKR